MSGAIPLLSQYTFMASTGKFTFMYVYTYVFIYLFIYLFILGYFATLLVPYIISIRPTVRMVSK